jgi:hypothetical protein
VFVNNNDEGILGIGFPGDTWPDGKLLSTDFWKYYESFSRIFTLYIQIYVCVHVILCLNNRVSNIIGGYIDCMKFADFMAFSFITFLHVLLILFLSLYI